jgi:hypothetical protein
MRVLLILDSRRIPVVASSLGWTQRSPVRSEYVDVDGHVVFCISNPNAGHGLRPDVVFVDSATLASGKFERQIASFRIGGARIELCGDPSLAGNSLLAAATAMLAAFRASSMDPNNEALRAALGLRRRRPPVKRHW